VTLALDALVVAGGIFFGRLIARSLRRGKQEADPAGAPDGKGVGAKRADEVDPFAGFVCALGDVITRRVEGDEAWLAGALLFEEERPVAALFIAPEAHGDRAVLVPSPAQTTLVWLAPLPAGEVVLSGDPPRAIEHAGTHFERTRRLPVRVRRLGSGAPEVGPTAVFGEYVAPGMDRLVVVAGSVASLAWRGIALSESDYEVLPGGKATLEP
jgi:hypothetical protein